ncbi:DUF192 domain-containing protein [Vineibacter terrae]|uniref:DUF192 domain-containing protein n=1 Tax=Vineibacter terrae TaxID=2586908 RepID=UPI002E323B94|nr:DUF192 domain-containing protein [Vineibacter terrae]HEX2889794.1 DUF192 domain-containing protein [Vineibacter terrae]
MRRVAWVLAVLLVAFGVAGTPAPAQSPPPPPAVSFEKSSLVIDTAAGEQKFDVELALTPEQQQRGLMFRQKLGVHEGMLFDFVATQTLSFWMANTLIPLDMLFIDADGTIARIHANAEPLSTRTIDSGTPVRAVLEINGGAARMLGIKPGDKVRHAIFGNAK